jgi:hypothetical protein
VFSVWFERRNNNEWCSLAVHDKKLELGRFSEEFNFIKRKLSSMVQRDKAVVVWELAENFCG